ncbi:DUF350 domain-containing protein [Shewanella sp. C32]|uniref:DUF350 domain-containing protein n=1 Tax=Shewanella electrica TaxID=515560 RepID=A0ABT2FHM7_9GAMM|nr:DUF350 domain-containing protein [Shewanella electrica]MCH1923932.1 DUF350 domain-containing protein [Shewanella electrica]MCS4555835.1 DUF350 domain-containing protein [Shewanella electrica]
MTLFQEFGITQELAIILAIDLGIAVLLLTLMRYMQGWSAKVNSRDELAVRDNFAFGISTAGAVGALGIVLTGAITGAAAHSYAQEAIGMASYGICGLILIKLGRFVHDKIALNHVDKTAAILKGNISVAIVDAGAAMATALVIRAVLIWAEDLTVNTFIAIFSAFAVSQLMLVVLTRALEIFYRRRNQGHSLQQALEEGNTALALRHAGAMLAMGFTFNAASHFMVYDPTTYVTNLFGWFVFSLMMLLVLSILLWVVKKLVLARIDLSDEIERQQNIGLAAVEMAISISIAVIMTGLMA